GSQPQQQRSRSQLEQSRLASGTGTARFALSRRLAATAERRVPTSTPARTAASSESVALPGALSRTAASRSVATATVALQRLRSVQLSLSSRQQLLRDEPVRGGDVAACNQRWLPGRLLRRTGGS